MPRALAAALGVLCLAAHAETVPLRVMGFGGSSNWPLFVAEAKGYFAREGLTVTLEAAPDSATQLDLLMRGRIDIALTAMDNVVAYREGQAVTAPGGDPDLIAFLGVNNGGRSTLMAAPAIATLAALKGAKLAVDSPTTGYAFVLAEMLRSGGLERGDYELVSVGASRARWDALREGRVAAALLNAPYDAIAQSAGYRRLASSGEAVPSYQGSVGAARRAWAAESPKALVAFIRAYVAAVDWLYEGGHEAEAIAILLARQERMRPEEAARSYEELLHPLRGTLARKGAIDLEGVRSVLRLRERHARPPKKLGDARRYYEEKYYEEALRP